MEKEKFGRIVKVRIPYIGERSFSDEIFYAAIDDDISACDAVGEFSWSSSDIEIKVVGMLSPSDILMLCLSDGDCRKAK